MRLGFIGIESNALLLELYELLPNESFSFSSRTRGIDLESTMDVYGTLLTVFLGIGLNTLDLLAVSLGFGLDNNFSIVAFLIQFELDGISTVEIDDGA